MKLKADNKTLEAKTLYASIILQSSASELFENAQYSNIKKDLIEILTRKLMIKSNMAPCPDSEEECQNIVYEVRDALRQDNPEKWIIEIINAHKYVTPYNIEIYDIRLDDIGHNNVTHYTNHKIKQLIDR